MDMFMDLTNIINACNTLHEAEHENSKRFFLFRRKNKKIIESNRHLLEVKIKEVIYNKWDLHNLYQLQKVIIDNYDKLIKDNNNFSIPGIESEKSKENTKFYSMYFYDRPNGNENIIILDIMSDNISFTIFDTKIGKNIQLTSKFETQDSQKKVESVCKDILYNIFINYLNDNN